MSEKLNHKLNSIEDNYIFLDKIGPRPIGSPNLQTAIKYFNLGFSCFGYETIIHEYPTVYWNLLNN